MLKRLCKVAISFCFVALLCGGASALESVQVQIAPFKTQISDIAVYNYGVEYPIITYKDISYIPMTYNLCKKLDIQAGFDPDKGLYIVKLSESMPTARVENCFGEAVVNSADEDYTAYLPEYPIYLNGIKIDNKAEEYPVLNFRGITYFPLTYRFCENDLKLMTSFSEERGLVVSKWSEQLFCDHFGTDAYVDYIIEYPTDSGNIEFRLQKSGQTKFFDEWGNEQTYGYFWWERYNVTKGENGDSIEKTGTYTSYDDCPPVQQYAKKQFVPSVRFTENNKKIFYHKTQLADFTDNYPIVSFEGSEYLADNGITFLCLDVKLDDMPQRVPYDPMHEEYLYVIDGNGIRSLEAWDKYSKVENVEPDGRGGYYIYSQGYYPGGYSRWLMPYRCVYRYTSSGEFYEVTVPDTNNVRMIGVSGTKLYVEATYHQNVKTLQGGDMSTVNSGFYSIDAVSGETVKLFPYFVGKTFLTSKGTLYGITSYSAHPRVINLTTGQIIQTG